MAEYLNVQQLVDDINAVMQVNTTGDIEADEMKKMLIGITELFVAVGTTNSILSGNGGPSDSSGINGDIYIDKQEMYFYGPKTNGLWGIGYPIVGEEGPSGKTVLNGSGAPSAGVGTTGDFYIDTVDTVMYGPKTTVWGSGVSLKGAPGTPGTDGTDGTDGVDGSDGNTILNGVNPPTSGDGIDGDFYYETTTQRMYGPKVSGAWGGYVELKGGTPEFRFDGGFLQYQYIGQADSWQNLIAESELTGPQGNTPLLQKTATHIQVSYDNGVMYTNLVALSDITGPDGADGSPGAAGKSVLSGTTAPDNGLGSEGDFYYRYSTYTMYGPKSGGVWPAGVLLKGADGSSITVYQDATEPTGGTYFPGDVWIPNV